MATLYSQIKQIILSLDDVATVGIYSKVNADVESMNFVGAENFVFVEENTSSNITLYNSGTELSKHRIELFFFKLDKADNTDEQTDNLIYEIRPLALKVCKKILLELNDNSFENNLNYTLEKQIKKTSSIFSGYKAVLNITLNETVCYNS